MDIMEQVCQRANLNQAYKRVKANKGAPGADNMTVADLRKWLATHKDEFIASLLDGSYEPQPVKGVQIPKPGGGKRQLGIPTVRDRLAQQAILQILTPILDPTFSDSSYGFRPGRSAHDALQQAQEYVQEGRTIVVDFDLEKFFDRVNHDMLMARLARHVKDKRLLRIVRGFLNAGIMQNGVCVARHEGTPQGGPLSPLLANLLLDDLDKELERRGHCFCRYADDCNIYVGSMKGGHRVMASVTNFLETKLKLRVNQAKSAVAPVWKRKFLGYRLLRDGTLGIAPQSVKRVKDKIRQITKRNLPIPFEERIKLLNSYLSGWLTYFHWAQCKTLLRELEGWIRRKLRCVRLKQLKNTKTIAEFLKGLGVKEFGAWMLALSGKSWWRKSRTWTVHQAMDNEWFERQGLMSLEGKYLVLKV
ncbi:MAG: group II intron reverse transcriptase/maturase [Desulfovibrio sp.]|nr:MAG: group II intron reverse transcriptase/maturase [Desulfovibrio sp.]